jgi:hypothetical protein
MTMQNVIRHLHKEKHPTLFIKLDISKAFDSLNWTYLLEVLTQLETSLFKHKEFEHKSGKILH